MPTHKITYSTELMANFKQATTVTPQKKFQALQTPDGFALLLSISNENIFYITQQTPGIATGWQQLDVSSALSARHGNQPVIAKTFAASQNLENNKLNLVLAVSSGNKDYLYLSLNNTLAAGTTAPLEITWKEIPYDDPEHAGIHLKIENLHIAQTKDEDFIVADISRSTFARPSHLLERYHIDILNKRENRHWHSFVMGGDLDPAITNALGRKSRERVDGIYTLGTIGGRSQLQYAPLYNKRSPLSPPPITRLKVPSGATTLAVAGVGNDLTDLFVAAEKAIYYFAADRQGNDAEGEKILVNDLFEDISHLYAFTTSETYVLWGLNRANQVFYTSCRKENLNRPNHWTVPIPILTNVNQVAPFVHAGDSSNTFFAVAGNRFIKATQSPQTSLWNFSNINLAAPVKTKAQKFSSYTTRIQLTDEEDQLLPDTLLNISASSRIGVYINHLYYVLTPTPIPVPTDLIGSITIIEEVNDLAGVQLFVSADGSARVTINPMEKPFQRIATLDSVEKLKNATLEYEGGKTKKLIQPDVTDEELKKIATANSNMAQAYNDVSKNTLLYSHRALGLTVNNMPTGGNAVFLPGVGFSFFSDLGNLFSWMASGISSIISFVKDAATNAWNLVVEIGGKIYHGVLNCVEKIVAAVKWVYDKIKTAIEDLIKFLEFLFQWKDFQRTKDVLYNFSELYMQREIKKIPAYKREFDSGIQQLVKTIEDWAKIGDMQLGDAGKTKITSKSKPASAQNAPGSLLTYHYQNNADKGETPALLTKADIKDTLIKVLFNVIEKQGEVFEKVINQFKALVIEAPRLSLQQILEKIVAIFSTAFLRGFQHLADALFDIIESVSQEMLDLLKRKVRIPVVSDILEYFGVSSLSALDLMCWITAIPATLLYKTIRNEAPFKAGSLTNALINAKSFEEIANAYKKPKAGTSPELLTNSVNAMYYSGHLITGTATLLLAVISPFEALDKTGSNETLSYTCIALGVVAASFNAVAGFISPRYPIENEVAAGFNIGLSSLCLLNKGLFSGVVQKKIGAIPKIKFFEVKNARGVGAAVDAVLALAGAGFTGYHFYELSSKPAGKERSQAILEESGNVASYLGRISYAATVNGASHSAPLITFFGVCTGGLHIATAIVEGE